jgi:hypothetical protein
VPGAKEPRRTKQGVPNELRVCGDHRLEFAESRQSIQRRLPRIGDGGADWHVAQCRLMVQHAQVHAIAELDLEAPHDLGGGDERSPRAQHRMRGLSLLRMRWLSLDEGTVVQREGCRSQAADDRHELGRDLCNGHGRHRDFLACLRCAIFQRRNWPRSVLP